MTRRTKSAKDGTVLLPGRDPKELVLTFAGNIVTHLGVKMYAGRPVPAIAELISNAWDADAKRVDVTLPLDEPWSAAEQSHVIVVADDGNGMTWDMVRDAYLDVGRDRRLADNTDRSPGGRLLQGRKGVGKLAGFGIADIVEIQTVHEAPDPSIKKKALIWFRLSLATLRRERNDAAVDLIYAGPIDTAPPGARRKKGTTVTLRQLHERRAQNEDRFHHAMAQRFVFAGPSFRVRLNGEDLRDEEIELQWRIPPKNWKAEEVPGAGPVQFWLGFTEKPRKQQDGEASGILIYTRQKVAQEAMFFDISGGTTGQHGLRYLVGKVKVEWLDPGMTDDLIATHRGAIAWESPQGAALQSWGQQLVKKELAAWSKRRSEERKKHVTKLRPDIRRRIDNLAPDYRDVALDFVDKFQAVEMEAEEFEEIFSWFLDALENATLRSILQKLKDTPIEKLGELDDLLTKMEVRTAVALLQIIDSNLAAIDALEGMHRSDAKERGVLSKHLEKNPWLIDPTWMLNKPEARVATWIEEEFGLKSQPKKRGSKKRQPGDDDRVDFFCVAVGGSLHIVEIKRGKLIAKEKEILQADKYRKYVLKRFEELTDKKAIKYTHIQSHLIAAELHDDARTLADTYASNGYVVFTTWDDLVERAKVTHQQFRDALERRTKDSEGG